MAFVSGNLGKEILQKAMKNANIRPNTAIRIQKPKTPKQQNQNQNQSPIVPKIDTLATRPSSNLKAEEPSPTILPYRSIPSEQVKCSCNVCQEKNGVKLRPQTAQAVAKPRMTVQEGNNKGFSHLLKLMLPDRGNAPKGLKFLIADTIVFTGGEPKFFMYNSRNKYIRFIKQKDKLALPEMKKFFLTRKQRKELDGINFFNENTMTMAHKIKDWRQKAKEEKDTERFFNAYEKSQNAQNSPSHSRKEKRVQDSTAHREIVICKYTDESLQVLSELDFSYLMMKRKIEAVWLQLDYIQSYIKLKKEHPYYVRVDYEHERDIKNPFYERAREYIYYMTQEREPELDGFDYTTAEDIFEEDLKKANIFEYCQYLNFKFVCYLDAYCGTRVRHMITEYAWEETNLVYLVNAYDIKFFNIAEQNDYILREVDIVNDEEKQKANDRIYNNKSSPYQGKVEVLWAFRQYYEDMKVDLDINKEFEETILENPTSNEAFKIINPETTFTLYDVMTNVKEFEKFKIWLQNRSMEPGKLGKLFKSALKFAETSATANMSKASAAKTLKSSTHRQKDRNDVPNDNAAKLFQKKMKILDICGNGVSRKKYIHTSEVLYRSDVVSGRKIITLDCKTNRSKMMSPMMSDQSTGRGLTATPSRQFRIRSQKTSTPAGAQSQFDISILNKTKSLTSMLYLKPDL